MLVVAFFYDDYCPTCDEVRPHWEEFKSLYKNYAVFLEIKDDEDTHGLFKSLGVSWIPAVVFYINDREVKRLEGSFDLASMEKVMETLMARTRALRVHQ